MNWQEQAEHLAGMVTYDDSADHIEQVKAIQDALKAAYKLGYANAIDRDFEEVSKEMAHQALIRYL